MKPQSVNQVVDPDQEDTFDVPLESDIIFSNHKGNYKKRIEKRQRKLLEKVEFLMDLRMND